MHGGVGERGVHGRGGICMVGYVCGRRGMHGGGGMHGRRRVWQERLPLQRTERILLQCILIYLCSLSVKSPPVGVARALSIIFISRQQGRSWKTSVAVSVSLSVENIYRVDVA